MKLNYELGNYIESMDDANKILEDIPDNYEAQIYKFFSYLFIGQTDLAKSYLLDIFQCDKYKTIQFIFNETAKHIAQDELAKGLKLLEVIELIDPDNPLKIFKEASIYGIAGENEKKGELLKKLEDVFPKYFISHFKYTDMYEERNLLEICFLLELKVFDTKNCFAYPFSILEGYKNQMEGHILDSKESFENAIKINSEKPEAYVLLAQTLQLLSGYDNPSYKQEAEINYRKAMAIYQRENLTAKTEDMKRQIKHLNSTLSFH
jgi:tetratricopeptide (TPR) repeat protein